MDWLTPVMGIIGVAVGAGIQEFRMWRERKDKYKDMVFERRLDAHQQAYYWCSRLSWSVRPDTLLRNGGVEGATKEIWEALEWLAKNALYLDRNSRSKMNEFILYVAETAVKYRDEKWRRNVRVEEEILKITERGTEVKIIIQRGVGVEYLPEEKMSFVSMEAERILGELLGRAIKDAEELRKEKQV